MPRSGGRWRQVVTVTALGALVVATVLAVTPAGPWVLRSAKAAPRVGLVVSSYACDLSNYGYTGPPVDIAVYASVGALATAAADPGFGALFRDGGPVSFATTAATLPASVASRLANLNEISLQAMIGVSGAPAASPVAKIWGTTTDDFLPTGPLTQLEVVGAVDTAFFSSPGTAYLRPPAQSLLFTPYRGGQPLPTISCTVIKGTAPAPAPAKVTVTGARTPGPVYGCASTYRTRSYRSPLPMTITTSGVPAVGHMLTVRLSSPATGLAAPAPGLATKLAFTGRLPVTGAQDGQVRLKETTPNADSPTFTVSGRFRLKKRGTDTIFYPRRFVYTVYLGSAHRAVFTCALATSPAPAGLTVRVAR